MFNRKLLHMLFAVVILGVLSTASTGAVWNASRTTYFTFSGAVQIPGVTLPAGTYVFELADPNGPLDVVRVLNKDRSKVYLTAFTRFVERPARGKMDPAIVFGETPAGNPPIVKIWYPASERIGREFLY